MKINILGTKYTLIRAAFNKDPRLENADGFCDYTSKEIVVDDRSKLKPHPKNKKDQAMYERLVIRHEIIHAFFHESGLDTSFLPPNLTEIITDWIALQFPKMYQTFEQAKCNENVTKKS